MTSPVALVLDIVSITLIIGGALFCLAAAIGMARFRDTISRMHPSSKPQTLGLILTLLGALIHILTDANLSSAVRGDLGLLMLIVCFTLVTSPIISNRIGHEALKERLIDANNLARNDIEDACDAKNTTTEN